MVTARSSRSLNIQHCKLVKNKGSAISISRCSATIENSVIKSNFCSSAVNVLICDTKFENIIKINRNIIASNKGTGIRLKGGSCGYHNKENHVISSNIIKDNSGDGIYVSGKLRQVTIISNEITKNGSGIKAYMSVKITNSNILNNRKYQVAIGGENVKATNNWWGTTNELEIRKLIYDLWDNPKNKTGKVIIKPFLTAPNPKAGVKVAVGPGEIEDYEQKVRISNVHSKQEGSKNVIIRYDFKGAKENYDVTIRCSGNNGETFGIIPKAVSGDVGRNVKPGKNRKIVWDVQQDFPEGVSNEFLFKVEVKSALTWGV